MSDSDNIKLWCWVLGDTIHRVISVSIERSATIEELTTVIQERKSLLKDITLDIFKVGEWYR
jgi:hypothetical protein